MTPAFGFSVGDFISGINLVRKITKALKETGGASSEYQAAVIELKGLKHALQHLQALEPTEDNLSHVNAIRGMALACQLPLRDFLTKLERFESSLGPWADRTKYRGAGRKARWAVEFAAEVEKLRAIVAAKQISINLLLATHTSQTISSINARTKQEHGTLMSKIAEQRATLQQCHESVERIESTVESVESNARALSSKVDEVHLSVTGMRSLGEQILAFMRTFPQDIRNLLQNIMQADWRTYQAVLQIQERLARSPTSVHDSNIQFTNVLGEYRELPYEFFCQWEPFEGFLRAEFKNKPGEDKISKGQFHIIDSKDNQRIVRREHWSRSISQGAKLTMSMIMSHLRREHGSCPRSDCTGMGNASNCDSSVFTCATCRLNFFPNPSDMDDAFRRVIISEDDVGRQQIEEDLRLYGSRPEPPDTVEVDESTQLANLPPKRSASEFEAAVSRPAKIRKKGNSKEFNYQALTAMDWNSGASPLDAWLNQSAVPSMTVALDQQRPTKLGGDLLAQEIEEIKVFRNVHMAIAPSPEQNDPPLDRVEGLDLSAQIYYRNILDRYPDIPVYLARRLAQANYDRAERLRNEKERLRKETEKLETEMERGQRIQKEQGKAEKIEKMGRQIKIVQEIIDEFKEDGFVMLDLNHIGQRGFTSWAETPASLEFWQRRNLPSRYLKIEDMEQELRALEADVEYYRQGKDFSDFAPSITEAAQEPSSTPLSSFNMSIVPSPSNLSRPHSRENISPTRPSSEQEDVNHSSWFPSRSQRSPIQQRPTPVSPPCSPAEFWTGGRQSSRPASVHSRSSSMNSSLHGRPAFDPEEQNPTFATSTVRKLQISPILPPPPVELGKVTTFNCDICGHSIHVNRRRQWQNHVFRDLRPYLCTFLDCPEASKTYASRRALLVHERLGHERRSLVNEDICIICREVLSMAARWDRLRHVCRHMEEIAFTVVSKPYEEWEFYSDGCSARYQGTDAARNTATNDDAKRDEETANKTPGRRRYRCGICTENKTFSRRDALARHNRVVHPASPYE